MKWYSIPVRVIQSDLILKVSVFLVCSHNTQVTTTKKKKSSIHPYNYEAYHPSILILDHRQNGVGAGVCVCVCGL